MENWFRELRQELSKLDQRKRIELSEEVVVDGETHLLTLTGNNCIMREACSICGRPHKDSQIPYWIFEEDKQGVCYHCASEYVPNFLNIAAQLNEAYGADESKIPFCNCRPGPAHGWPEEN